MDRSRRGVAGAMALGAVALLAAVVAGATGAHGQEDPASRALLYLEALQRSDCIEQRLRPLQRLEPAAEEHDAPALQAEPPPQSCRVARRLKPAVDARLGDADAIARRAVQTDEILGLGDASSHQPVRVGDQLLLGPSADDVERKSGAGLRPRQRVERLHPRRRPALAQLSSHQPAEPIVTVHEPIRPSLGLRMR